MRKWFNQNLIKIGTSILLFIISLFIQNDIYKASILILSYIIISYEIYIAAIKNIRKKEIFDENLLMIIATLGAFFIGSYTEAVMVMLLFEIGEYFSDLAVDNSKKSITKLMDLRVETVNLLKESEIISVSIEHIQIGDIFLVRPGEKIPLDGDIIEGTSYLDTSSLTGEANPRKVTVKDNVLSGCLNKESIIKVKSTSVFETTTASKIIKLMEESSERKTETENWIRKFAKIYTPIIVLSAILLVGIPTVFGGEFKEWLYRSLVFLVTSCPCALVISVPLGYFCGIGKSSKEGILIKGSKELENLEKVDYLLLDKTGTITEGVFEVTKINTQELAEKEFLKYLASAEQFSLHPIARAIKNSYEENLYEVKKYQEVSGKGLSCTIEKQQVIIGNENWLVENNIEVPKMIEVGTVIHFALDKKYQGYLVISDKIKETSYHLEKLKEYIRKDIIILSGDEQKNVSTIAEKVGIETYFSNLLPPDKVEKVEEYKQKGKVMFVGDGINDAPVIKIADVGVSMGGIGSDAAIEASDIVLMRDDLLKLKTVFQISNQTRKKVKFNIIFALTVKFLVLLLGIFGISTIWMAVFADVGVTFLSILHVLTIMWKKSE